jgi:hypothetical protein
MYNLAYTLTMDTTKRDVIKALAMAKTPVNELMQKANDSAAKLISIMRRM